MDFYESLFSHRREHIRNVTEIGVSAGQSIQMWSKYFPLATVFALDVHLRTKVVDNLRQLPNVEVIGVNAYNSEAIESLCWRRESMDIIIDDANHLRKYQVPYCTALCRDVYYISY